nr:hypothetical protein [uncultured Brevundimonas sp.]
MKPLYALKIIALSMALTAVLLLGWIGLSVLAYNRGAGSISSDAVLNFMLAALLAFIGLPILHRAFHRYFWTIKRRLASGEMQIGDKIPVFGSAPCDPPPRIAKTRGQIALYAVFYAVGIASLLAIYVPIGHQEALNAFLSRFSAGRSSFTTLATLVIIYLPMAITLALIFPFLDADKKLMQAGDADPAPDPDEVLRLQDRQEWLFSFATAYVCVGFLSFIAGHMIVRFL